MQKGSLFQKQQIRAIPVQIQANAMLNMNAVELGQFIEKEAMENPALEVKEGCRCPVCGFLTAQKSCPICGGTTKNKTALDSNSSTERDYLKSAFSAASYDGVFDPFGTVASKTSLVDYLKQQARMNLGGRKLRIAEYIIDSLDENGYFRESLYETAEIFATAVPEIETVIKCIQNFDPPGIAARDLRECLLLQIKALQPFDACASLAERMIMDFWEDFSKKKFKAIAAQIKIEIDEVTKAADFIREKITPHPCSAYRDPYDEMTPSPSGSIVPDIIIKENNGMFFAEVVDTHSGMLSTDETYDYVYAEIKSGNNQLNEDDRKHIIEHVERVKTILEAIALRKKTLGKVANHLVEFQKDFIANGPSYLKPLRQKDIAAALEVHESTICRALANKFCRLPNGDVISVEVFFDSALPVRTLIGQLIAKSECPMSDSEITKKLAEHGIEIARRTVAKYREQLKLLPYQLRNNQ